MARSITDRSGKRWNVKLVGPFGIGPTMQIRPSMYDLVLESDDGERIAVPILPKARKPRGV